MRKLLLLFLFICGLVLHAQAQKNVELSSPNGEIKVSVRLTDKIYYDVACNDEVLLKDNYLQLKLKDKILGEHPKLSGQKQNKIKETLTPVVPLKFSTINNEYNQLLLNFKGNYSVEFRAFNDGIAYRFITRQKGEIEVLGEDLSLQFPTDYLLHLQQPGGFKTAYEEPYTHISSHSWKPSDKMSVLPVLIDTRKSYKILISESDLSDYPCMFLKGNGTNGISSIFQKSPLHLVKTETAASKSKKKRNISLKQVEKGTFHGATLSLPRKTSN